MKKTSLDLLLLLSVLASIVGFAAFLFLFIPGFNVFTLIVSPIIIACYQAPAAVLFGMYRKLKKRHFGPPDEDLSDLAEDEEETL